MKNELGSFSDGWLKESKIPLKGPSWLPWGCLWPWHFQGPEAQHSPWTQRIVAASRVFEEMYVMSGEGSLTSRQKHQEEISGRAPFTLRKLSSNKNNQ